MNKKYDKIGVNLIPEKQVYYLAGMTGDYFAVRHYVDKSAWESATPTEKQKHWDEGRKQHLEMYKY